MESNKIFKKISFTLAILLILLQLFTISSFAESGHTQWSFSDDEQYLTNETEGKTYHGFYNGVAFRTTSQRIFMYEQDIEYADLSYLSVYANPDYPEAVWIDCYNGNHGYEIFVTDKGEEDIKAFTEGKIGNVFIENSMGERADFDKELIEKLDADLEKRSQTKTFDVRDLKPKEKVCEVYDIVVQDESKTFGYTYGAIYYFVDSGYWYVNYTKLDNNYFDADGNFSYRRGSVEMTKVVPDALISDVTSKMTYYEVQYEYEWSQYGEIDGSELIALMIMFWFIYVVVIVLPAIPIMILGFVLPMSKKLGKPKYWYSLVAIGALWLILAIVLAIYLIVAATL